jgi:hypothetical protein
MEATASTLAATGKDVRRFTTDVPEEQLADLRRRIDATKWPDRVPDASQGVQLETIQALAVGRRTTTGAHSWGASGWLRATSRWSSTRKPWWD